MEDSVLLKLAKKAKTPFFAFEKNRLLSNYEAFINTCSNFFSDFSVAYSVKTNNFPTLLDVLAKAGSSFEVSTLLELKTVLGKTKKTLVFNGPCKTEEELKLALKSKVLINADSISEIKAIASLKKKAEIGLRLGLVGKFGFEEGKIVPAFEKANSLGLRPVALHCHVGTQATLPEFTFALKKLKKVAGQLERKGFDLRYVNVGGGFPDAVRLRSFGLKIEDYFIAIEAALGGLLERKTLILEPGRHLVADTMSLVTRIHRIKRKDKITYAITDAGINYMPRIVRATYSIKRLGKERKGKKIKHRVAGPLLFANDEIGDYTGTLAEGDLLAIENVGAYCLPLSWTIGYGTPRVITV